MGERLSRIPRATIALVMTASVLIGSARPFQPLGVRATVHAALLAVEGDSVEIVAQKWRSDSASSRIARLGLATLARLTYKYPEAQQRYHALIGDRSVPTDSVARYAMLGLAWQADTRGVLAMADTLFARARTAAHAARDSLAEAEALLGLAVERAPVAGIPVGLAMLDSAHRLIPDDDADLQAAYYTRRSVLRTVMSLDGAVDDAKHARALARRARLPRREAAALKGLALAMKIRGWEDSANVMLDTVETIQRQARDYSALAETLLRHGDALYARGDLGRFKQLSAEAYVMARRSDNVIAYRAILLGMGALSVLVHDFASADVLLTRAIERSRADGDTATMMMARSQRIDLYLAVGAVEHARQESRAVAAYHHAIGDGIEEFSDLRDLIEINLRARDTAGARRALAAAHALARRARQPRWDKRLAEDEGAVSMACGHYGTARDQFLRALQVMDTAQHVARYTVRARLAEAYARLRDYDGAERELANANGELDRWRATLADEELRKTAFQSSARPQNNRDASVATTIALLAANGREEAAFQFAERRRARELTDRIIRASALMTDSVGRRTNDARSTSAIRNNAERDRTVWASLPDTSTMFVEYVTGVLGAPTTMFVVTRRHPHDEIVVHARVLPPADSLVPLISRFLALIETGEDPTGLSRQLGRILLDPALNALASSRLAITRAIIVPNGPLYDVPFDALRLADGRFAVEHFAVSRTPSGSAMAALRARGVRRQHNDATPLRLLAMGDPAPATASSVRTAGDTAGDDIGNIGDADDTMELEPARLSLADVARLPKLSGATREVQRVAAYAPDADVRLHSEATALWLQQQPLRQYRVLHFATHALVDERSDARTALVLAPADGNDGLMSPGDVAALSLDADLVVLSACRTAGGVVVDGEGVQGLTSSFLEAGARSVVATQWRIDDDATVQLVVTLYAGLARGLPVTEALRQAKLDAIRRGAPLQEWAALTVVGDPLVQIPLRHPAKSRTPVLWVIAMGCAVAVLWMAPRRWGAKRHANQRGRR
jgi:CHAT domain-containing protein